jgi:hypothetical protein
MNEIINLCKILDSQKLYQLSDTVFNKFASNQSIMDKKIFIPYEIKNVAEEAYKKRLDKINFGSQKEYDLARDLFTRSYLELSDVLKIHQYTFEKRYSHSKSKENPTYWEWRLYGGDEGRKWSSDIVRIYLPKKWKAN